MTRGLLCFCYNTNVHSREMEELGAYVLFDAYALQYQQNIFHDWFFGVGMYFEFLYIVNKWEVYTHTAVLRVASSYSKCVRLTYHSSSRCYGPSALGTEQRNKNRRRYDSKRGRISRSILNHFKIINLINFINILIY